MSPVSPKIVATFPAGTFLENIAVRGDHSLLLTSFSNKELYHVCAGPLRKSTLIHRFQHNSLGIVEVEPDVFYISTSTPDVADSSTLWRIDMNGYIPSDQRPVTKVLDLPGDAKFLNGSCLLSAEKSVVLLADSYAGLVWRVDLQTPDGPKSRVWLKHDSMSRRPDAGERAFVPGINGIQLNPSDGCVYWTNSIQAELSRVKVDFTTLEPQGEVEVVARDLPGCDDFIIDNKRNGAYVTTHPRNKVEWVSFDGSDRVTICGDPVDELLLGPTAAAWGRKKGDDGRVFYVTTEGGMVAPLEGKVREARVLEIELQ